MILSFLIVTAVLVVSLDRIGDMYGRVRIYNLGFGVFTAFSILLFATPFRGSAGALWLIGMRVGQGIGGAMLFANSSAIITDAFPANQRGLALGINGVAAIAGTFLGLIIGGVLGPLDWRLVFLVSVRRSITWCSTRRGSRSRPASRSLPGRRARWRPARGCRPRTASASAAVKPR
jgi:MFS family permease